jgi:2-keto-4-pentenoate hydratase/2-oxohepta-3-ene-1,7-dioic acid hydratase in catechol pathway
MLEKIPPSIPGYWDRAADDKRQNPYLFAMPPTIFTSDGDAIEIPLRRSRIDYECELAAVMGGPPARRVSADKAPEHIFGYVQLNDVSERGGRGDEPGADWFVAKGHDTFKPMGPYLVPKEFVNPLRTPMKFTLNGQVLQESHTGNAIHSIYELVQYASNMLTLRAGDMIALGTPPGVGTARKPPIYLKPGDTAVCSYEGFGTLTNPVVAERVPSTTSSLR